MRSLSLLVVLGFAAPVVAAEKKPNIVLLTCEDISPNLGCYGDPDAITPNLDKLAKEGARFVRAFSHAPVCAPSRSGLITGQYPTTMGSHHMRSKLTTAPPMYTEYLRKAGYTICWPSGPGGIGKTDFNFDPPKGWADVTEDWTKKPEVLTEPFFAVYNMTVTHESQARATDAVYKKNTARLKPEEIRDRAKVKLPPYYPDTPAVRECLGKYHDNITAMDYTAGDVLKVLDDRKLTDNTVVIFFGDHGAGLSRAKRWPYDSGLRVPFIVRWPGVVRPGVREALVCFLDIAPTLISIAGGEVPPQMPGRIFLGDKVQSAPKFVFAARDRMDETYDRVRSVRGERYRYVRNFHPELPYFQYINYMDEMPIMKDWRKLAFDGKLNDTQKLFWSRTKPKEELYDLETDPYEINNIATAESAEIQKVRKEMSDALDKWIKDTKDLGEVPEKELIKRGLVKDVLSTEYDARVKLHPKTPPVP